MSTTIFASLPVVLAKVDVTLNRNWYAGWGTLALVNAGLAQAKGRGGLNWFLISLFFGPLATLLIVVLDPPEDE